MNVPRSLFERLTETLCYAASMEKVELSLGVRRRQSLRTRMRRPQRSPARQQNALGSKASARPASAASPGTSRRCDVDRHLSRSVAQPDDSVIAGETRCEAIEDEVADVLRHRPLFPRYGVRCFGAFDSRRAVSAALSGRAHGNGRSGRGGSVCLSSEPSGWRATSS